MKTASICILCSIPLLPLSTLSSAQEAERSFHFKMGREIPSQEGLSTANELLQLTSDERLTLIKRENDGYGGVHERYQLTYKGVKVEHGIVLIHNKSGRLHLINGKKPSISENLNLNPLLTENESIKIAKQTINATAYREEASSELVILDGALVYKHSILASDPVSNDLIYVDATSGEIIEKRSQLMHANGNADTRYSGSQPIVTDANAGGQFVLHDTSRGQGIFTYNLNGSVLYSDAVDFVDPNNDNNWSKVEFNNGVKDIGALDAHWGLEMSYDYWFYVHQRNSYDGMGSPINAYIHYDVTSNSSWNPLTNSIEFGDRPSGPWTELDVVSHELGHGVHTAIGVDYYEGETGVISEGLADIFAACVTNYVNGLGIAPQKSIWQWGEETPNGNPRNFNSPATYFGPDWNLDGGGGAHSNAQILRYWFYLLSVGGSGTNSHGYAYNVPAQGISTADSIIYQGLFYLPPQAKFPDLKIETLQAAEDLYGINSTQYFATLEAWSAIGVFDPLPSYCVVPSQSSAGQLTISFVQAIKKLFVLGEPSNKYGYNLDNTPLDLMPGATYPIKLSSSGINPSWYTKMWVDLDRDGSFDGGDELVFDATNILNDTITGFISIPGNIAYGNSRLRVIMSNTPIASACSDVYPNGEMKDFNVNLIPEFEITTSDGYCAPLGSDASKELIGICKMGALDGTIGWYPKNGFKDFATYGFVYKLWIGETYPLKVGPKFIWGANSEQYFTIWIDYNGDKSFDINEVIFQGHTSTSLTSMVTIPANATPGLTRMRIAMSRGMYATSPCLPVENGEFMDYKIDIKPAQPLSGGNCSPRGHCYQGSQGEHQIKSVKLGNWLQSGAFTMPDGNGNFFLSGYSDSKAIAQSEVLVNQGDIYTLELTPTALQTPVYWKVWIDLNQNLAFEETELLYQNAQPIAGKALSSLAIPPGSTPGITRMRVSISFFKPTHDPCDIIDYGQMVDFLANVQQAGSICPAPSAVIPTNSSDSSVHLEWTPSSASDYEVNFRKQGSPYWSVSMTGGLPSIDLTDLLYGSTFDVRVRGICGGNTVSDWITSNFYTTYTCGYPLNLIPSNITETSAKLNWDIDPLGTGSYLITYCLSGSLDCKTLNVQGQEIILSGLKPGESYEISGKQICETVDSDYSTTSFVTVTAEPCLSPPSLYLGAPSTLKAEKAYIYWESGLSLSDFQMLIRYKKKSDSDLLYEYVESLNEQGYWILDLEPATEYQVSVAYECEYFETEWSPTLEFTTACPAPVNVIASDITGTSMVISWEDPHFNPGDSYTLFYKESSANFWDSEPATGLLFVTLIALDPATFYEVYVQKNCLTGPSPAPNFPEPFLTECEDDFPSGISNDYYIQEFRSIAKEVVLNLPPYTVLTNPSQTNSYYSDYTNLEAYTDLLCIVPWKEYIINVNVKASGSTAFVKAILDYDQNGYFSEDEIVVPKTIIVTNQGVDLPSFIPCHPESKKGKTTLRIISQQSEYFYNPCTLYGTGEVEDYTVTFSEIVGIDGDKIPTLEDRKLLIFPNPVIESRFSWSISEMEALPYELYLLDVSNQPVLIESGQGIGGEVTMTSVRPGLYVLMILFEGGARFTEQVIKE